MAFSWALSAGSVRKGIIHQKMKVLSFTHPRVVLNLYDFVFLCITEYLDFVKNVNKTILVTIDFNCMA